MKKIAVTFILITINMIILYGQKNKLTVIKYRAYATEGELKNDEAIKKSKIPHYYEGIDNELATLEYELAIKDGKSRFYLKEGLTFRNEKANRMAKWLSGKYEYYTNLNEEKHIKVVNETNEEYHIEYTPIKNWLLINEIKKIHDFICYKATIEILKPIKNDSFKKYTRVAWYCPQLPYPFGPKEYGKLPGLILELQEEKITYVAKSIDLDSKSKIKIDLEKNTKTISESEFNVITNQKTTEFKEKLKRYENNKK